MDAAFIDRALADIAAEQDPTVKSLKLASVCSRLFRESGIELVVVGGSAIEAGISRLAGVQIDGKRSQR